MEQALQALKDSELRVLISTMQGLRDKMARDRKPNLAAYFNSQLIELPEEKRDRKEYWASMERAVNGVTPDQDDAEWTQELRGE